MYPDIDKEKISKYVEKLWHDLCGIYLSTSFQKNTPRKNKR